MYKKIAVLIGVIFISSFIYGHIAKTEAASNAVFMRAANDSKVYQIINGKKLYLTLTAFNSLGAPWKQIQVVSQKKLDSYPRIKLMKVGQYGQVFYLTETGLKRHILNPEVFSSYGNKWEYVLAVDTNILTYPDNILIRQEGDNRVYELKDDYYQDGFFTKVRKIKRWIQTEAEFKQLGYNWNQVALVNAIEINAYSDASTMPFNCDNNTDCFITAAQNCKPAQLTYSNTLDFLGMLITNTTFYEIRGPIETNKCAFYLRTVKQDIDLSDEAIQQMLADGKTQSDIAQARQELKEKIQEVNQVLVGRDGICKFNGNDLTAMLTKWQKGEYDFGEVSCDLAAGTCDVKGGDFSAAECSGRYFSNTL